MLALSTTLFSTNYEWPSGDNINRNHQQDCNGIFVDVEANSYDSVLDSPTYDQIRQEFTPESSNSSGGAITGNIGGSMKVSKKLNHNASERDRRKRVNDIYAYLRSLMPISADQKKKFSIPRTVSLALEYIPELRKEVETLICKKEKLSSYTTSTTSTRQKNLGIKGQSSQDVISNTDSSVVSSVSILGEKEVVIQLIFSMDRMSKNKEISSLSGILTYLESEENGFVLLNLTTFTGEHMLLNTLHLQVQGDKNVDVEMLKEKLCHLNQ
ncbi:transcription factor ORG2-like protein [Tanacetum coccineum]|uniref:Transcription factor ORG2-like protein n=1 Tax=Tanacetum coccineum TaxID=301880 RepID=A0ABQ5EC40_9ASTR